MSIYVRMMLVSFVQEPLCFIKKETQLASKLDNTTKKPNHPTRRGKAEVCSTLRARAEYCLSWGQYWWCTHHFLYKCFPLQVCSTFLILVLNAKFDALALQRSLKWETLVSVGPEIYLDFFSLRRYQLYFSNWFPFFFFFFTRTIFVMLFLKYPRL